MVDLGRIRKFNKAIWSVPAQPPIQPPELPEAEDERSKKEYERALEAYNQRKDARRKRHEDTSSTIRRIYYAILSTALFCFSVIHGRKDVSFISTSSNVKLPIVNIDVSYTVFLLVGPSVILGLTAYVHIFLEEHRKIDVETEDRLATIFNMESLSARSVSHAIFYWLPPLTLFYFAWEAQPLRMGGPILLAVTVATALILFFLQIRRTRRHSGMTAFAVIGFLAVASGCSYFYMQAGRNFSLEGETVIDQDLTIMTLAGASLEATMMTKVDLDEVDLRDANLSSATIEDSSLFGADLSGANLAGATLRDVDLRGADLTGAIMSNARLLEGTRLEFTALYETRLDGADLSGTLNLREGQLEDACGDQRTRLPASVTVQNPEFELEPCNRRDNEIVVDAAAVSGKIDQQDGERTYTFGISTWDLYQVDIVGEMADEERKFDPEARVQGPNLEFDLYDDDSGGQLNSRIIAHLEPGQYSLVVNGYEGKTGPFTARIGRWDMRSVAGFDGIVVPTASEIRYGLSVDSANPTQRVRAVPGEETGQVWVNLDNPEGRSVVIKVAAASDQAEEDLAPGATPTPEEPVDPSELLLMLFDGSAAYTPIAFGDGSANPTIRCTFGLTRYLILTGSYFDRHEIDVTVALQEGPGKDPANDCFPIR